MKISIEFEPVVLPFKQEKEIFFKRARNPCMKRSVKSSGIVTKKSTPKNQKELSYFLNQIIKKLHSPEHLRTLKALEIPIRQQMDIDTCKVFLKCMQSFLAQTKRISIQEATFAPS